MIIFRLQLIHGSHISLRNIGLKWRQQNLLLWSILDNATQDYGLGVNS
jgi:hypothetical protein